MSETPLPGDSAAAPAEDEKPAVEQTPAQPVPSYPPLPPRKRSRVGLWIGLGVGIAAIMVLVCVVATIALVVGGANMAVRTEPDRYREALHPTRSCRRRR
jgi:hypothetical protein